MKVTKIALILGLASTLPNLVNAATLEQVMKKGVLNCGVSTGIPGFSATDSKGVWKGIDVDFCRSVAAAVLGDASKVKYIPLTAKERFTALQSGEIDLLSRASTWTATRDTSLGLNFAGVNYYDGQGFLVKKEIGVTSAKELDGASFCIQAGTTTELNLTDYFKSNNMEYKAVTFDTSGQTIDAFKKGRCDAVTSDASQLYGLRIKLDDPKSAIVLPDIISKEPLGPVVRQGDDAWFNVVRWSLFATLEAEELGVTASNVDKQLKSNNPSVKRLLGVTGKAGENLGLKSDWAYQIVKQVGNYEEMFDNNVGKNSPLNIDRGLNNLWNKGGLMYAMPIR
ncbi:MAG: amino acid ABC transporter substrate-binding protein [Moritella sp.]|uniref:amino acid ABC transporter substrate-binding protein n=1 Tax=unclassified Moritella TaxID=2637987 RepID=UPI0001568A89|nr:MULTISPECIES: amino acid ABC transporter substrate-binding protein [unclassified Moritella]EDM68506.1 general L-amino acid-binding protein [Moritella sp. PE36]MBL1417604.1 amino acid ABC transporter substrate-binding protein [Moritella sp.]PHR88942.1 MAG: amino acid ABC transporter substrate-binding protein [Moritella sp.]